MISDRDVWHAAVLIVKRYGDDAMLEAAERLPALVHWLRQSRENISTFLVVRHRLRVWL